MIRPVNNISVNTFKGLESSEMPKEKSTEDPMIKMTERGLSKLAERAEKELPSLGEFDDVVHVIDIPETSNEAIFSIKYNNTANDKDEEKQLSIGVRKMQLDRIVFSIIAEGDKEGIISYLKTTDRNELAKHIKSLSSTLDGFYFGTQLV